MIFFHFKECFDELHHIETVLDCAITIQVTSSLYKSARDDLVVIVVSAEEVSW